jgi:lysophospholipase L1-like esterase
VHRLAEALLESGLDAVDRGTAIALLPDGVHPSLEGQSAIARRAIAALAHAPPVAAC